MPEVWERTHRRKDGTWVDQRVEKAHSAVLSRCNEVTSQVTPEGTQVTMTPADVNRIASQVVPRNKRGKAIFMGSIPTDHFGVPVTSISYGTDRETAKKLAEQETKIHTLEHTIQQDNQYYDDIFDILAGANPAMKQMIEKKKAERLAKRGSDSGVPSASGVPPSASGVPQTSAPVWDSGVPQTSAPASGSQHDAAYHDPIEDIDFERDIPNNFEFGI